MTLVVREPLVVDSENIVITVELLILNDSADASVRWTTIKDNVRQANLFYREKMKERTTFAVRFKNHSEKGAVINVFSQDFQWGFQTYGSDHVP